MNGSDLRGVNLFERLPDSELKEIAQHVREVTHPAGSKVIIRGEYGIGFTIIIQGEVEIRTQDGRTRTLGPGAYFGEMSLLDQDRRSADVTAKTDLVCAAIPEWSFERFLAEHPKVSFRLLQNLSRRLREAEAR